MAKTNAPPKRRYAARMEERHIKKIPKWKKRLFRIADDLCYYLTDKDIDFILEEGTTEIQAENVLHRYRLAPL